MFITFDARAYHHIFTAIDNITFLKPNGMTAIASYGNWERSHILTIDICLIRRRETRASGLLADVRAAILVKFDSPDYIAKFGIAWFAVLEKEEIAFTTFRKSFISCVIRAIPDIVEIRDFTFAVWREPIEKFKSKSVSPIDYRRFNAHLPSICIHRLRIYFAIKSNLTMFLVFKHVDLIKDWGDLNYFNIKNLMSNVTRIITVSPYRPIHIRTTPVESNYGIPVLTRLCLIIARPPLAKYNMARRKSNIHSGI